MFNAGSPCNLRATINGTTVNYSGGPQEIRAVSNLVIPIELSDSTLATIGGGPGTPVDHYRTETIIDSADFEQLPLGSNIAAVFEVVSDNTSGASSAIELRDELNTFVTSINVPTTATPSRYESTFILPTGQHRYHVRLNSTPAEGDLVVTAARVRLTLVNAISAAVYVPLTSDSIGYVIDDADLPIDTTFLGAYAMPSQPDFFPFWKRPPPSVYPYLRAAQPWVLESVLANSGGGMAYAALVKHSTGIDVSGTESGSGSAVPEAVRSSFDDPGTGFEGNSDFQMRFRTTGTMGKLYKSGLWIRVHNLKALDIPFRVSRSIDVAGSGVVGLNADAFRAMPSMVSFSGSNTAFAEATMTCLVGACGGSYNIATAAGDSGLGYLSLLAPSFVLGGLTPAPNLFQSTPLTAVGGSNRLIYYGNKTGAGILTVRDLRYVVKHIAP